LKKKIIYFFLFFVLNYSVTGYAQYIGGNSEGYSVSAFIASACSAQPNANIYYGGTNDGHAFSVLTTSVCSPRPNENIYYGGTKDGYALSVLTTSVCSPRTNENIFFGGTDNGSSNAVLSTTACSAKFNENIFFGNSTDGASKNSLIQGTCPAIFLPIELIAFDFTCDKQFHSILKWITASENNNDYFTLEKSYDAINWNIITTVKGAGNSTSTIHYSFTDKDSSNLLSYYRLKQTDYDGKFEFSKIISSEGCFKNENSRFAYPSNPFANYITILNAKGNEYYEIVNAVGQLIFSGKSIQSENLSHLTSGIYLLTIKNENNNSQKFKLIKE
jgi:hypothetical protein